MAAKVVRAGRADFGSKMFYSGPILVVKDGPSE